MTALFTPTPANTASAQEFDDGDAPTAANVNPLGEAAFNVARWAADRVGDMRLVLVRQIALASGSLTTTTSNAFDTGTDYEIDTFSVTAGDYLEILAIPMAVTATASNIETAIAISIDAAAISGTGPVQRAALGDTTGSHEPAHPNSAWLLVGTSGTAHLWLRVRNTDGATSVGLEGPGGGLVKVWRLNT